VGTFGVLTTVAWLLGSSLAFGIDLKGINEINFSDKTAKSKAAFDPVMLKAQVLLDRARFSPGEIDGRAGDNFQKAIAALETAQGLAANGNLDSDTWGRLAATSNEPVLIDYMLTEADVKGPFVKKLPSKLEQMQDLDQLGYTSPREAIAEKFHMSERLLQTLNPGKRFDRAGETIVVANVKNEAPREKVLKVEIDKPRKTLRAFGRDDRLLAVFPASIGSKEKPAPDGRYKITSVTRNPTSYGQKIKTVGNVGSYPIPA
jgi:peptidoglycan hydrolase-like protein with peptidoglycan-binding domain